MLLCFYSTNCRRILKKTALSSKLVLLRGEVHVASVAIQQLFPMQILLPFLMFKLLPNVIFLRKATDLKLGSSTYFFPALFISGIHKVPSLKFKGG